MIGSEKKKGVFQYESKNCKVDFHGNFHGNAVRLRRKYACPGGGRSDAGNRGERTGTESDFGRKRSGE